MQAEQNLSSSPTASDVRGFEADLELAEMEITSGRTGDARLRFARMSREQRESPRALILRARASHTDESRRMLVSFIRKKLESVTDSLSRAQLAEALAQCGDREGAMKALPAEAGLNTAERNARQAALDAMGTVPDLKEANPHLTLMQLLQQKLIRRTQN